MTRTGRTLAIGTVLLAGAAAAAGVTWWWYVRPPSILIVTVDTLRPDRLGCYGHPTNQTPAIDRLAREGAIFERAYCDTPWTTGSMSSVMTGYYPAHHGLRLPTQKLGPEAVTLAEILHAQGFQTGAIIGSFPLDSVYGLDQGFETYDDQFTLPMIDDPDAQIEHIESQLPENAVEQAKFIEEKFKNDAYRPDEGVTDAAIRWIDAVRDGRRPFFLWVHYFGPHEKLFGNEAFITQEPRIVADYDPDVEANDRAVGRLLDHLRGLELLDDMLVVLHADHGQNLGEYDYVGHSTRLDEASVRIPLIVRYPARLDAGTQRRDIARNVDILPTVLDVTRTTGSEGLDGRSLLSPLLATRPVDVPAPQQVAYFETYVPTIVFAPLAVPNVGWLLGPLERHGVRTPDWRLATERFVGPCTWGNFPSRDPFGAWSLQNGTPLPAERCAEYRLHELLRADADDVLASVAPEPADVVATLRAEIDKHVARVGTGADGSFTLSPEQERKLKSLGYLQ